MKKQNIIFTLLTFLLIGAGVNAQERITEDGMGLFVRANIGYGFEGTPTVLGVDRDLERGENIYGSSAPGLMFGAGVGYMFNEYVGLELGMTYSLGKEKFSEVQTDHRPLGIQAAGAEFTLLTAYIFQEYTHQSTQLRLIPAVVIRGGNGRLTPYAKVGMVIPVVGKTKTSVAGKLSSTEISLPDIPFVPLPIPDGVSLTGNVSADAESTGKFSLGFDATLGMDYEITDMISVFGELNLVALTIKSKETKVTRYDGEYGLAGLEGTPLTLDALEGAIDGFVGFLGQEFSLNSLGLYENIDEVPESEKHFIYFDQLTTESNNEEFNSNFDENQPLHDYARKDNFSSVGINIGVKFKF